MSNATSIYDFELLDLSGSPLPFSSFKGKHILIVNTASECGYTYQYEQLQGLYELTKDKLVVIGCPCNDFGKQEPGSAEEITSFCQKNYGVSFPLTEKLSILGNNPHPLFKWLMDISESSVEWNFHKFLFDASGHFIATFPSTTEPTSEEILSKLGLDNVI